MPKLTRTEQRQLLADLLRAAADQLKQYQTHSDELRAIGRGLQVSSPYSTDLVINALIAEADRVRPR